SSRRRHTRSKRDWSSDVCSSDLYGRPAILILLFVSIFRITDITLGVMANPFYLDMGYTLAEIASVSKVFGVLMTLVGAGLGGVQIGRASCRERVWMWAWARWVEE